jgi:hypothetical protein
VFGRGETEFGLEDDHVIEVHIHHGFFQLGQTEVGGLNAVAIGNVYEINLGHLCLLGG